MVSKQKVKEIKKWRLTLVHEHLGFVIKLAALWYYTYGQSHIVLIILMCNYGHVLHAVHVHEPLRWVGIESSHRTKSFLTNQS